MQKYKLKGQWVSGAVRQAATLKKQQLSNSKEKVKTEDIKYLRAKYKEVHPEKKGVPPAWMNDVDKIKEKIEEFTK